MTGVEVVPYRERWPDEFRQIAAELREALAGLALRIDHIGSTSVPGLAAKDVIDIQVAVASLELEPLVQAFANIGYEHVTWIDHDHTPPWETTSGEQWWKALFQRRPPKPRANVHVRVASAANTRYALLFRDYLRTHPAAAAAYAELKRKLATRERSLEVTEYADLKDPACDIIVAAAEEWAQHSGWKPGPSDA